MLFVDPKCHLACFHSLSIAIVVRRAFISSSGTLTKYLTKAEDDDVQRTLLPFLSIPSQQSLSTVVFGFAFLRKASIFLFHK